MIAHIDTFLGYPVYFTTDRRVFAEARGIWRWKKIIVGVGWNVLPYEEQIAALLHEAHHCRAHHFEIRLLLLPICWTKWSQRIAQRQELACDRFAHDNGFGHEMLHIVSKTQGGGGEFYPLLKDRVDHLINLLRGSIHEAAA